MQVVYDATPSAILYDLLQGRVWKNKIPSIMETILLNLKAFHAAELNGTIIKKLNVAYNQCGKGTHNVVSKEILQSLIQFY